MIHALLVFSTAMGMGWSGKTVLLLDGIHITFIIASVKEGSVTSFPFMSEKTG